MMASELVKLDRVSKTYQSGDAPEITVLRDITLGVSAGESVAIVGPSGSGKSTLLNIIGTLDRPSAGSVWLDGAEVKGLNEKEVAAVRSRKIGFVFQTHNLLPHCSVLENVLVPTLALPPGERHGSEARGRKLLDRIGLGKRLTHRPGQLSGGERQRVAVVRALINEPKLVLADEPTGALDRKNASELGQLLVDLNREQRVTLIVVTHATDLAARMSRRFELNDGLLAPLS